MKPNKNAIVILLLFFLSINVSITYANPTSSSQSLPDNNAIEEVSSLPDHCPSDTEEKDKILPELEAEGAILIDRDTGKVLYAHNIDQPFYPASTTKILTALLAIENGNMEDVVTVSNEANLVERDGTIAGLDLGEEIDLEKLIYGLMLPSGNDAAYTIAVYIARKVTNNPDMPMNEAIDYFCDMMNQRARAAGAKNSHFSNPHGYHRDDHFTTPYDIAMIAREAMKYEFFQKVVATPMYTMEDWNGMDKEDPTKKEIRYWKNTNLLIDKNNKKYYYPYATGIKTGYTSYAGQCLVSSAKKDNLNLIAVVFKSTKDGKWTDSINLFEYGFNNFVPYQFVKDGEVLGTTEVLNCEDGNKGIVNLIARKGYIDIMRKDEIRKIEKKISIQPNIEAPVRKGQIIGQVSYYLDSNLLFCTDLIADRDIEKKILLNIKSPETTEANLNSGWSKGGLIILTVLIICLAFIVSIAKKKRKRRHIFYKR